MGSGPSRDLGPGPASPDAATVSGQSSECPVPEAVRRGAVYNVYNERIDQAQPPQPRTAWQFLFGQAGVNPANQMPLEPNQQPCPGQRKLLSTHRLTSTIPKGGTDVTWVYPSPQMFYNGESSFRECLVTVTQPTPPGRSTEVEVSTCLPTMQP